MSKAISSVLLTYQKELFIKRIKALENESNETCKRLKTMENAEADRLEENIRLKNRGTRKEVQITKIVLTNNQLNFAQYVVAE